MSGGRHVLSPWLWRRRRLRFAQPLPVFQLHHHNRVVRDRVCRVCRHVHSPARQDMGGRRCARIYGDQFCGQPAHGPSRVSDRDHQGGHPHRLHRGSLHRAHREGSRAAVASLLARSSGDLYRGWSAVRWLRGLRPDHECLSQHGQAETRTAARDLWQRSHCDRVFTCLSRAVW